MNSNKRYGGYTLALVLYPFVWGAVSINLFMLSLLWQSIGWTALSPWVVVLIALPVAIPVNWACVKWVRSLIAQAEV